MLITVYLNLYKIKSQIPLSLNSQCYVKANVQLCISMHIFYKHKIKKKNVYDMYVYKHQNDFYFVWIQLMVSGFFCLKAATCDMIIIFIHYKSKSCKSTSCCFVRTWHFMRLRDNVKCCINSSCMFCFLTINKIFYWYSSDNIFFCLNCVS